MSTAVCNGTVFTLGEHGEVLTDGAILFEGDTIIEVGPTREIEPKATELIDAEGRVVMPGLVCAHHHLYSTYACGIAAEPAANFVEVLEKLWWKLDRALDMDDVTYSALIPLIRCIRSGTTTILDHHASPNAINGSLAKIGDAVSRAGIRASLCYEVTDRNGPEGARAGIEENASWLERCRSSDGMLHGLVGLHAGMTVGAETLRACVDVAKKFDSGLHIHVAEDRADQNDSIAKYGKPVIERLGEAGGLGPRTMAIHCIHVNDLEIDLLRQSGTIVVHNPQSNQNNGVGCARVPEMMQGGLRVGLGTDGMTSNMLEEARASIFIRHHVTGDPASGWGETAAMLLQNNPAIASDFFGKKLGVLEAGAAADIVIADYWPFTPAKPDNTLGHILYGVAAEGIHTTICAGRVLMRARRLESLDMREIACATLKHSPATWQRFANL